MMYGTEFGLELNTILSLDDVYSNLFNLEHISDVDFKWFLLCYYFLIRNK